MFFESMRDPRVYLEMSSLAGHFSSDAWHFHHNFIMLRLKEFDRLWGLNIILVGIFKDLYYIVFNKQPKYVKFSLILSHFWKITECIYNSLECFFGVSCASNTNFVLEKSDSFADSRLAVSELLLCGDCSYLFSFFANCYCFLCKY